MSYRDLTDETAYDRQRLAGLSRRGLLRLTAGLGAAAALSAPAGPLAAAAERRVTIVKPLPPELFIPHGTNAEMRWEAMRGQGHLVPTDRFFVRNHTSTPLIDARSWRLRLFGTGLHGAPGRDRPVEFSYEDLLGMPAESSTAFVECAGNGRSFYGSQQGTPAPGTPWTLGGVGVARWRGVRLATVLERAGLTGAAVDVLPSGLDPEFVEGPVNLGRVRRPLPVAKALQDTLLAYEMNGEPLPPDHGFPVRLIVPNWTGISSIKWVGEIEVADRPLFSPWNTQFYRLFGPSYPEEGSAPLTNQVTKSAFELPREARLAVGRTHLLTGRSWSGAGRVRGVRISTDGGASWRPAHPRRLSRDQAWLPWTFAWRPERPGPYTLLAEATDSTGATQPREVPFNRFGYLFGAVVRHPVTVG
ncbi:MULTISPECIES: sulfite oxidase [unclassified Crossiella]|uniref:sulfite oxidase n=1 Tax=unclassified Crossiella TaxID=2620835 RepID=UPI001FFF8499|nr:MULTISPECIES: sulfite oxidase [unclassified Crossiella]MCK2244555.1 sulfite oxidase [Crossiella sp. S99.2]MCK2258186.1 sulfite oxidase [Crossiella sp. S99.1]